MDNQPITLHLIEVRSRDLDQRTEEERQRWDGAVSLMKPRLDFKHVAGSSWERLRLEESSTCARRNTPT